MILERKIKFNLLTRIIIDRSLIKYDNSKPHSRMFPVTGDFSTSSPLVNGSLVHPRAQGRSQTYVYLT